MYRLRYHITGEGRDWGKASMKILHTYKNIDEYWHFCSMKYDNEQQMNEQQMKLAVEATNET